MTNPYTGRDLQHLGIVQVDVPSESPVPVATSTNLRVVNATIASGESSSTAIELNSGERIVGIIMPAAWTTANFVPSVSYDGSTYQYAISYGAAIQIYPVAGCFTAIDAIDADKISRLPYVKLVSSTASGTAVTPVNQTAERVLSVVVVSQ